MKDSKLRLFKALNNVYPQPNAKKDVIKKITWSISWYFSRNKENKEALRGIALTKLANEYIEWVENARTEA